MSMDNLRATKLKMELYTLPTPNQCGGGNIEVVTFFKAGKKPQL